MEAEKKEQVEYLSELLMNNFSGLDFWCLSKRWKKIRCMYVAKMIYEALKEIRASE